MADLESTLREGLALEERRHFEEAIAVYARHPGSGECQLGLGRSYHRERRYPEAVNAYFQAGSLLLAADRPEDAHTAYSAIIALEKELAAGYSPPALNRIHTRKGDVAHGMARILFMKGSHEQALRLVTTALESEPNHVGMRTTLGLVHQQAGREDEALEEYQAVIKMHRRTLDEAICRERLAVVLAKRGAPATTIHDHYLHAGLFYEREGKLEKALNAYGAALQQSPQDEETVIRSAGLLLSLKRSEQAATVLTRLETGSSSLAQRLKVLSKLQEVYEKSGRTAEATEIRRRVEGLSGRITIRDLVPDEELIVPTPAGPDGVRRIPEMAREGPLVRLDFPATPQAPAGSLWLSFHPEIRSNQDVLAHMCEQLGQPAEKIIPHVQRQGENLRLPTGQVDPVAPDAVYEYIFRGTGVLFVNANPSLPPLDWSTAQRG